MRKYALLAAVAGMSLAGVAKADFQLTTANSGVSPATSGFTVNVVETGGTTTDTWQVYALNNGTGDQAGTTKLLGVSMHIHDNSGKGLQVVSVDNGDGTSTVNWDGTAQTSGDRGTYVQAGKASQWFTANESGDGSNNATDASYNSTTGFVNFADISVTGTANVAGGGIAATSAANGGKGALIGQIVFNHGDNISFDGQLGAESGPPSSFATVTVPEPASISLLGLGIGALMMRRRRA